MESVLASFRQLGFARLAAILGALAGVGAVVAAIVLHVAAQPQALLYSNLDLKEAQQISTNLDAAGIKHSSPGDGSVIMVDRNEVNNARMMLASKGLPTAASVGYEIFDNAPTLGQTEFVQNLDNQRALEGELARTINSLHGISSTRVHLVMPKRELFEDEAVQPTASVVVGLSAGDLTADNIRAIRNLIAGAVPNLKPENVTLVDDRGHTLATGGEDDSSLDGAGAAHKSEVEEGLRKRIQGLVEGVVGAGASRVVVSADVDNTATTQEKLQYDPDGTGPIVRSTSTNDGTQTSSDGSTNGGTTASNNIPGGTQTAPSIPLGNSSKTNEEVTNNEISTLKTTTVTAPGEIKKVAVSVLVDDVMVPAKDAKSAPTYVKRPAADIQNIHDMVAAAVAAYVPAPAPGQPIVDPVKVVNISFNHNVDATGGVLAKKSLFDFDKNDIMRFAEMGVLFVVALLALFLVARPLLKFISSTPTYVAGVGGALAGPGQAGVAGPGGAALAAAAGGPQLAFQGEGTAVTPYPEQEQRIDIARIEGQVKASSVKKVSEFVDRHPEESVSILRGWLHDT